MTQSQRWTIRPDGSNWGDFGPDDQIGRLNLITPERRKAAAAEVREGIAFCLSLPLDCPRVPMNPRRFPPQMAFSMRGDDPVMNYPYGEVFPGMKEAVCDDRVTLSLQYSTQWDALCHMGCEFDAAGAGEAEVTYYNGYRANEHVCGPVDYLHGRAPQPGPHGAHALGIERIAETGLQGRGVMIDLFAHVGLAAVPVSYERLMAILEADKVVVEPGDVLCFRTGFDRALLGQYADARRHSIRMPARDWTASTTACCNGWRTAARRRWSRITRRSSRCPISSARLQRAFASRCTISACSSWVFRWANCSCCPIWRTGCASTVAHDFCSLRRRCDCRGR